MATFIHGSVWGTAVLYRKFCDVIAKSLDAEIFAGSMKATEGATRLAAGGLGVVDPMIGKGVQAA
jgi:hypothetical protein